MSSPKILLLDIETAPILAYVWGLWDQNIGLGMVKSDWHVLSWSAKWFGDKPNKTMYMDQRNEKNIENDKKILKGIWDLIDEADIIITQNGKKFDEKKLNARFIQQGFPPPSSVKHIDTLQIAKRKFGFTSNKLEYMSDRLCKKYKKLKHGKFPGFELWKQCLAGNLKAWKEMEKYNKYDVLSLEELYIKLQPWDTTTNFNMYHNDGVFKCNCGNTKFKFNGFHYTKTKKQHRKICTKCGAEHLDAKNLWRVNEDK